MQSYTKGCCITETITRQIESAIPVTSWWPFPFSLIQINSIYAKLAIIHFVDQGIKLAKNEKIAVNVVNSEKICRGEFQPYKPQILKTFAAKRVSLFNGSLKR